MIRELKFASDNKDSELYLQTEASILHGRHLLLWGSNALSSCCSENCTLKVNIHGEGVTREGMLKLKSRFSASSSTATVFTEPASSRIRRLPKDGQDFLQKFEIAPSWGLREVDTAGIRDGGQSDSLQIERRTSKRIPKRASSTWVPSGRRPRST